MRKVKAIIQQMFQRGTTPEDYHLQISDHLGALAKELKVDNDDEVIAHVAACLNFLAVMCGTEDRDRLRETGDIAGRFANQALDQYATPEPEPEETLRRLTERGIDIACSAMRERNWVVVTEGVAKLIFLDDLSRKVASGEEVLKDRSQEEWADVIGE